MERIEDKDEKEKIGQVREGLGENMARLYRRTFVTDMHDYGVSISEISKKLGSPTSTIYDDIKWVEKEKRKRAGVKDRIRKRLLMVAKLYAEGNDCKEISKKLVLPKKLIQSYLDFLLGQEEIGEILNNRRIKFLSGKGIIRKEDGEER